jgi:hypothetical protein
MFLTAQTQMYRDACRIVEANLKTEVYKGFHIEYWPISRVWNVQMVGNFNTLRGAKMAINKKLAKSVKA